PLLTQMARKNRLRGRICGQCEVKTAGIMCAECTENYCVGCFARFHQKGALKRLNAGGVLLSLTSHCLPSIPVSTLMKRFLLLQVLAVSHGEEKKVDITGPPPSLLRGEYSEEESVRSFQEALKLWRGKENDGFWIPATQTALPPDREAEGQRRGGGEERVPVMVEFTENSLTYMDRLLLKKHRRYRKKFFFFFCLNHHIFNVWFSFLSFLKNLKK
uniref:B box-type domain-containing protein n=1 Tax=Amphilophus citrinellus TaxID=61819 RepID=A0A3Q0RVZ1_AMPCI